MTPLVTFSAMAALMFPAVSQGECANEQLRQSSQVSNVSPATGQPYDASLPDCRAYEQVSPTEKEGGTGSVFYFDSPPQVLEQPALPMQSLANGSAIVYVGEPFFDTKSATREEIGMRRIFRVQYTSERLADGWSTHVGNTLSLEGAPTPPAAIASAHEILEESRGGGEVFYREAGDLYEYRTSAGTPPTDLTPDTESGGAEVQGLLGVGGEGTEEGSYVYFVAAGVLAPPAPKDDCTTTGGLAAGTGCNLYMSHDGITRFIATLAAQDEGGGVGLGSTPEDWSEPDGRTAEVSPSGRYVAFVSTLPLTGQHTGAPEIFRYDAETGDIKCMSCGSDLCGLCGSAMNLVSPNAAINGANRQRYMLNDGRVFFNASGRLAAQDVNRQTNVYEWEPPGVGSCSTSSPELSEPSGGCVDLISGGTGESPAVLTDASENGGDAFFTTSESLVPQDRDEITDVYDAREGGGFPPPPAPACLAEAACPGPIAVSPSLGGTPASATFSGTEGPPTSSIEKPKPAITRAQKLAKALKACHAKRSKKERAECEGAARKRYGPVARAKKPKKRKRG